MRKKHANWLNERNNRFFFCERHSKKKTPGVWVKFPKVTKATKERWENGHKKGTNTCSNHPTFWGVTQKSRGLKKKRTSILFFFCLFFWFFFFE